MSVRGNDLRIKANEIMICYNDLGEGKIPVIFIHGFPFDKSMWQPQLDFFKKTHRVIAFDIRGFGKSTAGRRTYNMSLLADDLINLMDALQIKKAIIAGLSMGGYVLLNALNRYQDRFESIILGDTQCIADSEETRLKRYKAIALIEHGKLDEYTEGFIQNIFCKATLANKKDLVEGIRKTILSTTKATLIKTLAALVQRSPTCSILPKITIPTFILCGMEDAVTPVTQSEFMLKHIAKSNLKIIAGAGHLSNLEQPDEFNQHVFNFIS